MPLISRHLPKNVAVDFRAPTHLVERKGVAVPQLYQWNAVENPNYPLFVYDDGGKLEYITYAAANAAMDRAARYVLRSVGCGCNTFAASRPVVAILANTGASRRLLKTFKGGSDMVGICRYDHLLLHHRRGPQGRMHRVPHLDSQHRSRGRRYGLADRCDAPYGVPRGFHGRRCG